MSTITDETPIVVTEELVRGDDGDWDDDLVHLCCSTCEPRLALCGGELDDEDLETVQDEELCVVCLDLVRGKPTCPTCKKPIT